MKVIIGVQSSLENPYDKFLKVQKETWGKSDIKTIWFYAGPETIQTYDELMVRCSTAYDMQHWKLKLALEQLINLSWDLIFITHSSSYVNIELLKKMADTLPIEKCYAGSLVNNSFLSGSGFWLSRDVANILINQLNDIPIVKSDVMISELIASKGVKLINLPRFDYEAMNYPEQVKNYYHIRFNNLSPRGNQPQNIEERMKDVERMKKVHEYLTQ